MKGEAVLVFPSTPHMLRAEALLQRAGFSIRLVPAPPQAGELCTTAIALPASRGKEAADLLGKQGVMVKTVLFPGHETGEALASLTFRAHHPTSFSVLPNGLMETLSSGENLRREDLRELLEREDLNTLCRAAEELATNLSGRAAVPAVLMDLDQGLPGRGEGFNAEKAAGSSTVDLEGLVSELRSLGIVYLIISLGKRRTLPWSQEEFRKSLAEGIVPVVYAEGLPSNAGELVRDYGIRQILLRRSSIFRMDPGELTDEIVFLRDNRPGPVGSGNLLPLLSGDIGNEDEERIYRRVLAVLRIVLVHAFLPIPGILWKKKAICGGNLILLEPGDKPLEESLEEANEVLSSKGWSIRRISDT